ncbi:MAG: hypothetical protein BWX80_00331 [Candidatus Hydrogenedentes bacterium ADurb.Bin101]|nr:MAG: hypothetical protein BWX80_00331 [Candidatus Hydrogenedentes bacterium ADurb.Bin101]
MFRRNAAQQLERVFLGGPFAAFVGLVHEIFRESALLGNQVHAAVACQVAQKTVLRLDRIARALRLRQGHAFEPALAQVAIEQVKFEPVAATMLARIQVRQPVRIKVNDLRRTGKIVPVLAVTQQEGAAQARNRFQGRRGGKGQGRVGERGRRQGGRAIVAHLGYRCQQRYFAVAMIGQVIPPDQQGVFIHPHGDQTFGRDHAEGGTVVLHGIRTGIFISEGYLHGISGRPRTIVVVGNGFAVYLVLVSVIGEAYRVTVRVHRFRNRPQEHIGRIVRVHNPRLRGRAVKTRSQGVFYPGGCQDFPALRPRVIEVFREGGFIFLAVNTDSTRVQRFHQHQFIAANRNKMVAVRPVVVPGQSLVRLALYARQVQPPAHTECAVAPAAVVAEHQLRGKPGTARRRLQRHGIGRRAGVQLRLKRLAQAFNSTRAGR